MEKEFNIKTKDGTVSVNIMGDGTIQISGILPFDPKEHELNIPLSIWKMYQNYRSNDSVIRSGSGLCGVYPYDPKQSIDTHYIESDTLHSTSVEELARNIFRFYPGMFDVHDQKQIIELLRYHDLGETIDNPDDGSKDHDEKFAEELETFVNKISYLVPAMQEQLIRDFIIFENAGMQVWDKDQRDLMMFAKLCDKTDAPLGALLYESQGRPGSLLHKKEHFGGITEQDEKYAREIDEYSQAGIWTAHLIDTYRFYDGIELFIEILIEACKDVRGEIFPWMRDFCEKRQISERLLKKM